MSNKGDFRDQLLHDLEVNRRGQLSDRQLAEWQHRAAGRSRGRRGWLGRILHTGDVPARDVAAPTVDSVEGAIRKQIDTTPEDGDTEPDCQLHVVSPSGQVETFHAVHELWDAAPEFGLVRLYYLPDTRTPVNVELLRAAPMERVTADDARAIATEMLQSLVRGDIYAHGQAVSRMAAMADQMLPDTPPAAPAGGTPLAEAILGRWTAAHVTLTFRPDGALTLSNGRADQAGRWKAPPHGDQLCLDLAGHDRDAEAHIHGDSLTLIINGRSLRLRRDG